MAYSSPRHSQNFYQYDTSTPPPPPPKSNGPATPSQGPPLPPPPPGQGQAQGHNNQDQDQEQANQYRPSHEQADQLAVQPPDDTWLPSTLSSLPTKDLHHVLQTPELQHAIIHDPSTTHPSLPASTQPIKTLLTQNVSITESLQQLESHIQHQRENTQSRLLALRALERQWKAKQAEQDEVLRAFSPPALYQRLSAAVGEQEALCRGLEESFLEGEGFGGGEAVASEREVADFVRRLREGRKVAYLRAERKERWDEGRVGGWR